MTETSRPEARVVDACASDAQVSRESAALVKRVVERLSDVPHSEHGDLLEWVRTQEPLLDAALVSTAVDRAIERSTGYGPVGELLQVPGVTEVMVNGPGPVWVDCSDGLVKTSVSVTADEIGLLIERILDPLGLRVDRVSPMVDARLSDGSRVNVVVPPLAVSGPVVTIRRFSAKPVPIESFASSEAVALLNQIVSGRSSVVVVGGTGSGKTTLLNAMGAMIPETERVVVVEDTSELRLPGSHVVRLESRSANSEGVGEVTLRELVRNALRMRPDRLVIGEVRGGEAFDLLLALNTGHDGSLTTCHANGPDAGLRRLETLCLLGGVELPLAAIRDQIASAIDYVVHLARESDGRRKVQSISSVEVGEMPRPKVIWSAK